jgi:hypothetical protein
MMFRRMALVGYPLLVVLLAGVTRAEGLRAQVPTAPVSIRAFADFNYIASQRPGTQGFREGQFALHANATLSDRLAFFGELSTSAQASGFSVEIERAFARFDAADWLKLSGGRFHTPIGFWNNAYHHGTWLQTSAGRPEQARGGSGFFPLHFVGIQAEGTLASHAATVRYVAGVGNGRGSALTRPGDAGDANPNRAWTIAASVAPHVLGATRLGASYYRDLAVSNGRQVDEGIASLYAAYDDETQEITAEYVRTLHTPRDSGGEFRSEGYYAQIARRLPGALQIMKPYVRGERVRPAAGDPLFAPLRLRYDGIVGGVRTDVAATAAIKIEYRRERFDGARWFHAALVQLSFTFPGLPGHTQAPNTDGVAQH